MQHLIHGERFKQHPLSEKALQFPAMLGEDERRVLAFLASNLASPDGKIVELGCYLGGSTAALVDGIRQANILCDPSDPMVISYDLFIANQFMVDHSLKSHGIQAGQSFHHVFCTLLGENRPYVREVPGDIRQQHWDGRPIDLLFVDILWGWDINQHVISQFYTALIPGRSVIAHQDYIYSFYPWLPISMEYLCEQGYFEFGDLAQWGTVIFGVKRALDETARSIDFQRDLSLDTKEKLLCRSSDRFVGYPRALLELSRVVLLAGEGRRDDAWSLFEGIAQRYPDDTIAVEHVKMVQAYLEQNQPLQKTGGRFRHTLHRLKLKATALFTARGSA